MSSPTVDFGSTWKARSELSAGDKTLMSRAEGSMISGAAEVSVTTVGRLADEDEGDEEDASGEDIGESGG